MPRLILKSQFSNSTTASFSEFLNYMSRKEALISSEKMTKEEEQELQRIETAIGNFTKYNDESDLFNSFDEINNYIQYMGRKNATQDKVSLFSNEYHSLNNELLENIKNEVAEIEKNQGNVLMYQDVFSFSKDSLVEMAIDKNNLSESDMNRIYESVSKSMDVLKESEKLNDLIWVAVPHINTDNLHIHVMALEKENSRKEISNEKNGKYEFKGKRDLKTVEKMKSQFGNVFFKEIYLENFKDIQKSRDLLSKKVLKENLTFIKENKEVLSEFNKLFDSLPANKNNWNYNGKHITDSQRESIDFIVENLTKDSPEKINFLNDLGKYEKQLENTYGNSDRFKDYKKNKLDEIRVRNGNSLLKNLKQNSKAFKNELIIDDLNNFFSEKKNLDRIKNNSNIPPKYYKGIRKKVINKNNKSTTYVLNRHNPLNKELYKVKKITKKPTLRSIGNKQINALKKEVINNYDVKEALKDYQKMQRTIQHEKQVQEMQKGMEL